MRIGQGFDAHRFGDGDFVTLGGVHIAHDRALIAHSDGDVAIHALCDALLGAAAMGDIGQLFPDSDQQFANADSRGLLRTVRAHLDTKGYRIQNADVTIIAQTPRIAAHIAAMRANIAADLRIDRNCVSIKATTTERMGAIGREEGIAAIAVALISE